MSGATWLASYPRSGNTWVRLALHAALHADGPLGFEALDAFGRNTISRRQIEDEMGIDSGELTGPEVERLRADYHQARFGANGAPSLVKVHDRWDETLYPARLTQGAAYLVRDPRDVALSWAAFRGKPVDWAIDFLADPHAFLGRRHGKVRSTLPESLGSWSGHVRSWLDTAPYGVVTVRYEDLIADTAGQLARILAAMGKAVAPDAIARAVEGARFERLAGAEQADGFAVRPPGGNSFFRAGRAGSWKDVLTPAQVATIERSHGETMARLGYLDA
jgi:hypothetical protein